MYRVQVKGVSKSFGQMVVLKNVSLEILPGELFFLLGPSGCGKTTLLRVLTGFEAPDKGQVFFDDHEVTAVPPSKRNSSMVFQSYALWPHMTVSENIAYGLENRNVDVKERRRRVDQALELVRLPGFGDRLPNQLSGGQQQRVALARALVVNPGLLLLDEPLSNLDARLRAEMREELLRLHEETKITTVYVTHDQEEALSMADRIAFMDGGELVQVDTPRQLYRNPSDIKTGVFLGNANVLPGTVKNIDSENITLDTPLGALTGKSASPASLAPGSQAKLFFRPEDIVLTGGIVGTVRTAMYAGSREHLILDVAGCRIEGLVPSMVRPPRTGDSITFGIDTEKARVFAA